MDGKLSVLLRGTLKQYTRMSLEGRAKQSYGIYASRYQTEALSTLNCCFNGVAKGREITLYYSSTGMHPQTNLISN